MQLKKEKCPSNIHVPYLLKPLNYWLQLDKEQETKQPKWRKICNKDCIKVQKMHL